MKNDRGYSLIELLVIIAIFGILASVVAFSSVTQRNNANLKASAEGIVALIRQAKSYGTGVRPHNGSYEYGYGVHLEENTAEAVLFVDENKDLKYDSGEEIGEPFKLVKGVVLEELAPDRGNLDRVNIIYLRPNIQPIISGGQGGSFKDNIKEITINLKTDDDQEKNILVNISGKISIE